MIILIMMMKMIEMKYNNKMNNKYKRINKMKYNSKYNKMIKNKKNSNKNK